jgi:glycosyltransferase 2 family protein
LLLLFTLYRDLNFSLLWASLVTADIRWLGVLGAAITFEQFIRGWKWRQILFDLKPIPSGRLFGAILAGYGATALIPLGISPLVRSWLIARLENLRMASVLMTTTIERFIDGIIFSLIALLVAWTGWSVGMNSDLRAGIAIAGALNLFLFSGLLWFIFRSRGDLAQNNARISRGIDWVAAKGGARLEGLREAIAEGVVWPRAPVRQVGVIVASCAMKAVAASHFVWAGLAVGVVLAPLDYLFLMVVAGFAMVLARFVRVPGGFVIGAGFAIASLGVADEQGLAMIMFNYVITMLLMVGAGLVILWRSGIAIRSADYTTGTDRMT